MDIQERLKEMKARYSQNSELSNSDKTFVATYFERVTGKEFHNRGCSQCYKDAFIEMYIYISKNRLREMGQFILKRGVVRRVNGEIYNRISMTDEVALAMLKDYPQRIDDFEEYPENWKELTAEKTEEVKSEKKTKKSKEKSEEVTTTTEE